MSEVHNGDGKQGTKRRGKPGNGGVYPPEEHQFKKGQSGNPKGRPKGRSIRAEIRKLVNEASDDESKDSIARELAKIGLRFARRGSYGHWRGMIEEVDGKVADKLEATVAHVQPTEDDEALADEMLMRRREKRATVNGNGEVSNSTTEAS